MEYSSLTYIALAKYLVEPCEPLFENITQSFM